MNNNILKSKLNIIYVFLCGIASLFSAMALSCNGKTLLDAKYNGFTGCMVFAGLFYIYILWYKKFGKMSGKKIDIWVVMLSAFLAVLMVLGISISANGNLSFITGGIREIVYSFIVWIGYFVFFTVLLDWIYFYLDNLRGQSGSQTINIRRDKMESLLDKKPILFPFVFLLVAWLPYWIAFAPGNIMWDPFVQLDYYFGIKNWSDWHPIFVSLIFGTLMKIGRTTVSDNFGLALCIIPQYTLLAFGFSYTIETMRKLRVSAKIRKWLLLFCGFFPLIPFYAISLMKDTIYYGLMMIFFSLIVLLCFANKVNNGTTAITWIKLFAVALLISLTRKNGVYVCVGSMILLLPMKTFNRKEKAEMLIVTILIIAASNIALDGLANAVGADRAPVSEALSIPFQQTARTVKYSGGNITEEEKAAIDGVLDYERIGTLYDPDYADPVKGTFKGGEGLENYFKTWFEMLFKYPNHYITATLCGTYSYWYPSGESTVKGLVYAFIEPINSVNTGFFEFNYVFPCETIRTMLEKMVYYINKLPAVGAIMHLGMYTWVMIIMDVYFIRRKNYNQIAIYWPCVFSLMVCMASPVNGYARYFMPVMLMIPFCLAINFEVRSVSERISEGA